MNMNDVKRLELSKEVIENRKVAMDLARRQALSGDPVCGGLFALESLAHSMTGGATFMATTAQDWRDEDEDDEMRPY
jgi:hypothetical protein